MKVILNAEKVENEFYPKQNSKKRGNLLKINENREYVVKEIATDSYGTFFKLAGIQKPFDTKWFYVSEVSPNESVYAKADVYAAAEYGITADSIVEEGTLNVVSEVGFRHECKVTMAFYSDTLGEWLFELEGHRFPVLQKYMEVISLKEKFIKIKPK